MSAASAHEEELNRTSRLTGYLAHLPDQTANFSTANFKSLKLSIEGALIVGPVHALTRHISVVFSSDRKARVDVGLRVTHSVGWDTASGPR